MLTALKKQRVHKIPLIRSNWWVAVFVLFSYGLYSHGVQKKKDVLAELQGRFLELHGEKQLAIATQEELRLQVQSQDDPAWIEMTLMKGLGLVPEGQRKVYFQKQPN